MCAWLLRNAFKGGDIGGQEGLKPPTLAGEGAEHPQNTNTAKLNLAILF